MNGQFATPVYPAHGFGGYDQQSDQGFGNQGFQGQSFEQDSKQSVTQRSGADVGVRVNKFVKELKMPRGVSKAFKLSHADIACYFGGFFTMVGGYYLLNTGGAGQIVPMAAAVQLMGFVMAYVRARMSRSVAGISPETLHVWLAGILCRLSVNATALWSDHADSYLPSDGTCDWAYQVLEMLSAVVLGLLLLEIHSVHQVPIKESKMSPILIVGSMILSMIVHPKLNNCWSNMRFAAGQYMEGIAMLPQIMLLAKQGGKVEALTSHYIACSFVAQLMMLKWWHSVQEILKTEDYPSQVPGRMILLFALLSVLLLADFMYQYVKAIVTKASLVLPGFDV